MEHRVRASGARLRRERQQAQVPGSLSHGLCNKATYCGVCAPLLSVCRDAFATTALTSVSS